MATNPAGRLIASPRSDKRIRESNKTRELKEAVRHILWLMENKFPDSKEHCVARTKAIAALRQSLVAVDTQLLEDAGCMCSKSLLGYTPGIGPRCRLCNITVDERTSFYYCDRF